MQENMFNPLAIEMRLLYEALHDSGFNEEWAFELTKTYCSVAFVNHVVQTGYERRRTKADINELMRTQLAKYKEETTND